MRLIFVNRFYWPDEPATAQLLADVTERLAAAGREVLVIASQPAKATVPRREVHQGVAIIRVGPPTRARSGLFGKLVEFLSFFVFGSWRLFRETKKGDVVVCLSDPPLFSIPAALLASLCGARLVHWIQDIYPEVAMVVSGKSWPRLFRPARNAAWRSASACVTLGTDMAAVLSGAGVSPERIFLIPNWAPEGLGPPDEAQVRRLRTGWGLADAFVVEYSGNLGRVHELAAILDVAEALRPHPSVQFLFVGGGAQRAALEAEAVSRQLPNIQFRSAQPRGNLAESLGVGDVHLVTLKDGCERCVFPSKLYGILAVHRPVIFIGPIRSEISQTVCEQEFGESFTPKEISALAKTILALQADPLRCRALESAAGDYSQRLGGAAAAARAWIDVLASGVLAERR